MQIYSSGESSTPIRFNMLHGKCGSRLKQQYICSQDGEIVSREEMVRGFEFAKGQYVLFSDEELKALQAKSTQTIEITEFLPTVKIDPLYFEKTYYLGPGKGGDRAYKLLARALQKSGRSALAKYAARGKMYLVLLRPLNDGLLMQQLRYADEVRSMGEVPLGDAKVKKSELELALQIVDQAVADTFKPEAYQDEVRKRTMELIEKKIEGQEITAEPIEEPKAQVIDLMEALKASLGKKRKPAKAATPVTAVRKSAAKKRSRG